MTLDELLADRDAGLGYLMRGMGFTREEAVHLLDLLAAEHAEQQPDQPTPARDGRDTALGAAMPLPRPGPSSTPTAGAVDRRRNQTTGGLVEGPPLELRRNEVVGRRAPLREIARGLWWTVLSWRQARRGAASSGCPEWTEPKRTNLQRLADNAEAQP